MSAGGSSREHGARKSGGFGGREIDVDIGIIVFREQDPPFDAEIWLTVTGLAGAAIATAATAASK